MKGGLAAEELELATDIGGYSLDPGGFAKYVFPWESEHFPSAGPRTWQSEIMEQIKAHLGNDATRFHPLQLAVASGHSIGKMQHLNDLAITPDGVKRWGDQQVGDAVFGADGKPTKIIATHHYQDVPMYRVTFDDRSYLEVSSGHLWNVQGRRERRRGLESWRNLDTQQILDLGVKRSNGKSWTNQWQIPVQGAVEFEPRKVSIHPYVVGIWLGDGHMNEPVYTKPFPELAEKIRGLGYDVKALNHKAYKIQGIKNLQTDPVFSCRSHERYIPDDYKYQSAANRYALFQGLCDSDGEVHKSGSIGYSSTSLRLAEDMIWLARSLGYKAMKHPAIKHAWYPDENGDRVICRDCYRVTINCPINPFTLEHRKRKYKPSCQQYGARWIDSIERIPNADGMCITVASPDGLYQARDFIVTHNSALISMIMSWAMSTCEDCKIVVTAGTGTQLATKTAPEVQKWFRMAINTHWWDINATSIRVKDPLHQAMWRADFITWSIQKTEAFAGLHNLGKRIVIIFDEASAIDDKIWEVTEGALADEGTEIIWIAFGNPTRNSGAFYTAITGANRWKSRQIDARTVEGTNKVLLDAQIKEWGEDSDRARVRIRGEFPRGGSTQFIPGDLVAAARLRVADGYQRMPVILAVDVARFGDNKSVICKRQGRKAEFIGKFYGADTQVVGAKVQEAIDREHPDAVVIDGDGIGGAVYDFLKARGYDRKTTLVEFHGGQTAQDPNKYLNRRAEVWGDMKDWLIGGDIPDEASIDTDLTGPDYGYHPTRGCIALETKDDMRSRGVDSPDEGDALAMSFAVKVAPPKPKQWGPPQRGSAWS